MNQSAVRGAILANEVGTGKTMVFFEERKVALDERLAQLETMDLTEADDVSDAGLPPLMPTVVFAPASVVEQHFNEISDYFPAGTFHVRVFHGSVQNTSHNPALQKAVIKEEQLMAEMELAVHDKHTSKVSAKPRRDYTWGGLIRLP